ncbi:MAG: OsmC family protein [Firmicutes bacterium]|nr:OsmC family protein [Bacillota bacterium]
MQVEVTWVEGMEFRSDSESGHTWNMDASVDVGGNDLGPRPTELLLSAVGGCTGIDIVSILKKMQQPLTGLRITVSGERAEEHPRRFTHVKLHYVVTGDGLSEERVARAVELSVEKYCSVLSSLNAEVTYDFEVVQSEADA